jgi:hypothetical protein
MNEQRLDVVKLVKDNARREVGRVPSTTVVPHKNKKAPKHPKRELEDDHE